MIDLSKDSMKMNLQILTDKLFSHPEISHIKMKELKICRSNKDKQINLAIDESFHDCYSDIDLCVAVNLPIEGTISPDEYIKHIEYWGFPLETLLGIYFVPENNMYRIIHKNGIRYDLKFAFVFQENSPMIHLPPAKKQNNNIHWPMEKINQFWFVQIQALGKLYRNDFLISGHLANININETLVQQMVLRDLKYNTNHHRYGYQENFAYSAYTAQCPYQAGNPVFDYIADRLYSAALAYDELVSFFYDDEQRSKYFFAIWKSYEEYRNH